MKNIEQYLISHIEKSFDLSENLNSKIDDYILGMDGMTGTKTRHFYNNLLNMDDARYLEIGSWKGSSTCSAMSGNKSKILCIDNWSEFGGPKNEFISNFTKYKGNNDATFIENDCFSIDISNLGKFNIFLYDGNHTYESHYKSLSYYYDIMDDIFILIIDDWNWDIVREATMNSINDLELEIIFNKSIILSENNITTHDKETWWNGISVFLLKKINK